MFGWRISSPVAGRTGVPKTVGPDVWSRTLVVDNPPALGIGMLNTQMTFLKLINMISSTLGRFTKHVEH